MNRLTFEGNFCDIAKCAEVPGGSFCENGSCSQKRVWERLKEYEDTGVAPADVAPVIQGQWIPVGDMAERSECGECVMDSGENGTEKFRLFRRFYNFCPNCGVRMEEDHAD